MFRFSKILALLLAALLLIDQSVAFAYDQVHEIAAEFAVDRTSPPSHDGDKGRDTCAHCTHSGHCQSHFLGHITDTAPVWLLPLGAGMLTVRATLRIPITSLEPPYRPPRIPG